MRSVVFTFGRMNPPTVGHEMVVSKVLEAANRLDADHCVYLSFSHDNKSNPLEWNFKHRVCESAFPGVNISDDVSIKTPFAALESLAINYDNIVMVAGGDQSSEYVNRFASYATAWGVSFSVINAGERINESAGVEGISATKMREYASENKKEEFYAALPSKLNAGIRRLVFENTKRGLKRPKK